MGPSCYNSRVHTVRARRQTAVLVRARAGATVATCLLALFACPCLSASARRARIAPQETQYSAVADHRDFPAVISKCQEALARTPHDVDAEIGLAQAYRAVHNYNEAKSVLLRAEREHPRDERFLAMLGDLEIELQAYEDAARHLSAALALQPDDTPTRIRLAVARKSTGDLPGALEQLAKVLARDPKNPLAYYERAQIYSDQNQETKALSDAERAVELQPNAPARLLLAKILLRSPSSGNAAQTEKRCSRAVETLEPLANGGIAPSSESPHDRQGVADSETLFLLSRAYQCAGQNEQAERTLAQFEIASKNDRSTKENQTEAKHLVQQANDAAMKNDFAGAVDLLQGALEKDPTYGPAYSQLAKLYYSTGDLAKASDSIEKALARDPYQPDFLYVQGKILEKQGRIEEALASFERTTLVNPSESDAYFEMGTIYQQRNERARAVAAYKKAVALSPNDPDYRRALAAMQ